MKIDTILFDLDGTLWEVIDRSYLSAKEITEKYNLKEISKEEICKCMGLTIEECARIYFPDFELEKAKEITRELFRLNSKRLQEYGGNIYDGLEEVIKELVKSYKLGIISNCGTGYIESFLHTSNLEKYFSYTMAAGQFGITKASAIKEVINKNNSNAIYVGDTIKDLEAANEANIPFIHARYGFGKDLNQKYQIFSITELPNLLKTIN